MRSRSHNAVRDLGGLLPVPDAEREAKAADWQISQEISHRHEGGDVSQIRGNCATCKHRREHERERVREMGFVNCALLKPHQWIPGHSRCQFEPGRWEAK